MTHPRLSLALASGLVALPESGVIVVFGARADDDLGDLPRDRLLLVTGFAPDHAALSAAGYAVATEAPATAALAIVFLPRAKPLARDMIAQAARISAGPVVVDGLKTDAVESLYKDARKRCDVPAPVSKAHGKLFVIPQGCDFTDWAAPAEQVIEGGYVTAPGVFSADGIDPASRLLAATLPHKLGARVADLGAGWGYLATQILARDSVKSLDLVEAEHAALACARRNVRDPRAAFHWADATTWRPAARLDTVVMNPPFHTTRAAEPSLGRAFIQAAAAMLAPSGTLWMVANRHLAYEAALKDCFTDVSEVAGDNRFKVLMATRPTRQRR